MYFKQIVTPGLGCFSYIVGCPGAKVCAVVDPKRDIQDYLDISLREGMRITHIIDTHVHADHVSGGRELQSRTGADIYLYETTPAEYDFKKLKEHDLITLGNAQLEVLHTPGHTPDAISLLITDSARGQEPWMILTGDLLFVGDVGRPDLAGDEVMTDQAENLYNSLYNKLGNYPDYLEVFPAHGQGSLCGRGMSYKGNTTLGFERAHNHAYQFDSQTAFMETMMSDLPTRPKSFTHIITTNKNGAPLSECCPIEKALTPEEVRRLSHEALIIDARDKTAFAGMHIPGSINIGLEPGTANWIGMVVDAQADIILIVDGKEQYDAMRLELLRIGYDRVLGYLNNGLSDWVLQGYPVESLKLISARELKDRLMNNKIPAILDVRTVAEWKDDHLNHADHIPLPKVLDNDPDLPKDKEIVVMCASGYRSNIAAAHLKKKGFKNVMTAAGGMIAFNNLQ